MMESAQIQSLCKCNIQMIIFYYLLYSTITETQVMHNRRQHFTLSHNKRDATDTKHRRRYSYNLLLSAVTKTKVIHGRQYVQFYTFHLKRKPSQKTKKILYVLYIIRTEMHVINRRYKFTIYHTQP